MNTAICERIGVPVTAEISGDANDGFVKKIGVNRPNFHRGSHFGPKEGAEGVFLATRSVGDCPDPKVPKRLYSQEFS